MVRQARSGKYISLLGCIVDPFFTTAESSGAESNRKSNSAARFETGERKRLCR
jgi:hypothetical protein